jgi:hypothetical protein
VQHRWRLPTPSGKAGAVPIVRCVDLGAETPSFTDFAADAESALRQLKTPVLAPKSAR